VGRATLVRGVPLESVKSVVEFEIWIRNAVSEESWLSSGSVKSTCRVVPEVPSIEPLPGVAEPAMGLVEPRKMPVFSPVSRSKKVSASPPTETLAITFTMLMASGSRFSSKSSSAMTTVAWARK
jgi:hypothetical protein